MDVVCISSDSENSNSCDAIKAESQQPFNPDEDVFVVDWDNDFHPPVDYDSNVTHTGDFVGSPNGTENQRDDTGKQGCTVKETSSSSAQPRIEKFNHKETLSAGNSSSSTHRGLIQTDTEKSSEKSDSKNEHCNSVYDISESSSEDDSMSDKSPHRLLSPGTSSGEKSSVQRNLMTKLSEEKEHTMKLLKDINSRVDDMSNSIYDISESQSDDEERPKTGCAKKSPQKTTTRNKLSQSDKATAKLLREQKKLERERVREEKKLEQQRQRAYKAAFCENQRNLKPEENIKFLKVHIDNEIINSCFGCNIITHLQQNSIQYAVEAQKKSCTITWSKKRVRKESNNYGELTEKTEIGQEKELLYVMEWDRAVRLVHTSEFLSDVETVNTAYPGRNLTVVICGLEKYFNFFRNQRNAGPKKNAKLTETEKAYQEAPRISKDQLEFCLTDLQLLGKHNSRLLETPEELSALVYNITKSLSQLEYKKDKQRRVEDDLDWFAKADSSQGVKVDRVGNGLLNLWRQQICQFSSVGMETAQAVVSQYNSPVALVAKYRDCGSVPDSELLLQNLQVRREAGLLSSTRRLGPQLSKKIYRFFMSDDPDAEL